MTVELGVTHTWIGDLVVKLISPANTVVTLLSRPGYVEPADDGTNAAYGDSSNISNASPITFSQSAVVSAETMGTSLGTNEVACGTDLVCSYLPANGAAAAGDLSAFNGQISPGTWKLCIGDSGSMDTGSIDAVTLTINH
jgi:subtilisin-like proprotein convertase family protein